MSHPVTKMPPDKNGYQYESYRGFNFHLFAWEKGGEGYSRGEWGANVYSPENIYPIAYGFSPEKDEDAMRDVVTEFIDKIVRQAS